MTIRAVSAALIIFIGGCAAETKQSTSSFDHPAPKPGPSAVVLVNYMCPMHKEVVSPQPGKCAKCGMMLAATQPTTKPSSSGHVH